MPRISLDGFRDPARRPRMIIWTVAASVAAVLVVIVALGVTSTYWFCANGCHKVQDDTITAYNHSSHAEVSCMACHMPVNADPVTFLLHKAEALGELYLTVTNNFRLPLNGESELSLEMDPKQCTQCHGSNRAYTPSEGIIIDHVVHADNDVSCTVCHNRVAHREDFELQLKDPKSGEPNRKHADFMTMTACFRCHSQEAEGIAPGACEACHPTDFELKPANHFEAGFYQRGGESAGHAELAKEALAEAGESTASAEPATGTVETASFEASGGAHGGGEIRSIEEIFYCGTCHAERFCTDCHGVPMPHPAGFTKGHGDVGRKRPAVCANCHAKGEATAAGTEFCNSCHHPEGDPTRPWIPQHFEVVRGTGANACFECHNPTYCAECHVGSIR
jgi:hypothetical protein